LASRVKESNGSLKKHQIVFNEVCFESEDVCEETAVDWNVKLSSIMEEITQRILLMVTKRDCFLMHCQAKHCLKGQRYTGGKHSKQRLTVFLCGL
jgi:hypothetical protein